MGLKLVPDHLSQVSDREAELEAMTPEQRVYEVAVEDALNQVADFLKMGEGDESVGVMVAADRDGFDVNKFHDLLTKKADATSVGLKFRGSKKFAQDLCLRVGRLNGCTYIIVAPFANFKDNEIVNSYRYQFEGPYYIFKAEKFVSSDKYKGRRWWDVLGMVSQEFGQDSQQVRDVDRVVRLVRSWLYGDETGWHREALATELVELRLKVGAAAIA